MAARWAGSAAMNSVVASLGSFADFLYAPFNLVLIANAIGPLVVADYSPALQFDAALLLLVGAIATTILPRAMRLATDGDRASLRKLYVRSTSVSAGLLACAAIVVWQSSPIVLRLWLGRDMPVTLAILPLVLIHTVVGGTAGIGRAVLLGMGRFRAYTVSFILTNRTMCREMPWGSATRWSSGHSSSGTSHGRSSKAGSTRAEVMRTDPVCMFAGPRRCHTWLVTQMPERWT